MPTTVKDTDLLEQFIARSGLRRRDGTPHLTRIAREQLLHDERTVQRWRARESPIPKVVTDHLVATLMPASKVRRARRRAPA